MTERERFDMWALDTGFDLTRFPEHLNLMLGFYKSVATDAAYRGWVASAAEQRRYLRHDPDCLSDYTAYTCTCGLIDFAGTDHD